MDKILDSESDGIAAVQRILFVYASEGSSHRHVPVGGETGGGWREIGAPQQRFLIGRGVDVQ